MGRIFIKTREAHEESIGLLSLEDSLPDSICGEVELSICMVSAVSESAASASRAMAASCFFLAMCRISFFNLIALSYSSTCEPRHGWEGAGDGGTGGEGRGGHVGSGSRAAG